MTACVLRSTTKKRASTFLEEIRASRAGGFSDLEMTWLLYCAGAATGLMFLFLDDNIKSL